MNSGCPRVVLGIKRDVKADGERDGEKTSGGFQKSKSLERLIGYRGGQLGGQTSREKREKKK